MESRRLCNLFHACLYQDAFLPLQARPVSAKDAPKASVPENAGALKAQIIPNHVEHINPWLINPWFINMGGSILVANDHLLGYLPINKPLVD